MAGGTLHTPPPRWTKRRVARIASVTCVVAGVIALIWAFRENLIVLYLEHIRDEVRIAFHITPGEAEHEVSLNGRPVSTCFDLPLSNRSYRVLIWAPGYRKQKFRIRAHQSQTYHVTLLKRATPTKKRRSVHATRRPRSGPKRCPPGMALIPGAGDEGYCIDRYEHPGNGKIPRRGASAAEARSTCHARGARLCTVEEWVGACGTRFPYGASYSGRRCNTGAKRLVRAGSKKGCRTRRGVFDLSGNVSEWVQGGVHMGGDVRQTGGMVSCRASSDQNGPFTGFRCCADIPWE